MACCPSPQRPIIDLQDIQLHLQQISFPITKKQAGAHVPKNHRKNISPEKVFPVAKNISSGKGTNQASHMAGDGDHLGVRSGVLPGLLQALPTVLGCCCELTLSKPSRLTREEGSLSPCFFPEESVQCLSQDQGPRVST